MTIRSSFHALVFGSVFLVLAAPSAALAAEVRNGTAAVVAPGETVNDDLFTTGQTVTIAGRVVGDVYAAGGTVVVTGTVDGDLIAGGVRSILNYAPTAVPVPERIQIKNIDPVLALQSMTFYLKNGSPLK